MYIYMYAVLWLCRCAVASMHANNMLYVVCVGTAQGERRRRWGSSSGRVQLTPYAAISSDTLEGIIPEDVKAESSHLSALGAVMSYPGDEAEKEGVGRDGEEEDLLELETRRRIEARMKAKQDADTDQEEEEAMDVRGKQTATMCGQSAPLSLFFPPSLSFIDKSSPRSPSPAQNPPSRFLHVEHLTRPFTILQLKELLEEDGKMSEGGFWTNRIKSHCIAIVSHILEKMVTESLSLSLSLSTQAWTLQ